MHSAANCANCANFENLLLLQNGTVLTHRPSSTAGEYDVVALENHSILIVDGHICKIAPTIAAPSNAEVIDCTDKLISPGFIDTHRHLWQTQLKGRHADELLHEYFWSGNFQAINYKSEDVFWGQLAGCLESIDGGTTTVVDHSHINVTSDRSNAAIAATIDSGLRTVYCYTMTPSAASWAPFQLDKANFMPDWALKQLEFLSTSQPYGGDRVTIGLGFDGLFMPQQVVVDLFTKTRTWGSHLITMHYLNSSGAESHGSLPVKLADYGLLGPDILFSHLNQPPPEDAKLLGKYGGYFSSTPGMELQMGHGLPVCFQKDLYQHASLGVDCHSATPADMLTQMRLGLTAVYHQQFIDRKKNASAMSSDLVVVKAFNLATIQGARAIGKEKELGSLEESKKADIIVLDATSPAMVCGSKENPVASLVLHASVRDIETVIIGGVVRKSAGKLVNVNLQDEAARLWDGIEEKELSWRQVSEALWKSREDIIKRMPDVDGKKGAWEVLDSFGFDKTNFVNEV